MFNNEVTQAFRLFTVLCPDLQEFMKATVDMADLLGLHLVMSRNAGKGEYKIMVAAMGWATAELVMSRYNKYTMMVDGRQNTLPKYKKSLESGNIQYKV